MDNSDVVVAGSMLPGYLPDSVWQESGAVRSRKVSPLYVTRYAGPRGSQQRRSHPFWEITYVFGGEGAIEMPDGTVSLGPDGVIMLPPDVLHREQAPQAAWDTLWIGFNGHLAADLAGGRTVLVAKAPALRPWFENAWLWGQREKGVSGPELDTLGEFLVRALVRLAQAQGGSGRCTWLTTVLDHIDDHLDRDLCVEAMAGLAGFSAGHFHREFRHAMGETPVRYLTRRRLERALLYLRQSALSVKSVAEAVGFSDPLYFSRVFRRQFGYPPSRARTG